MESFTIILKNDRLRSYRRIAILILLLHFFFFNYYLLKVETTIAAIAGIVITAAALVFQFIAGKKNWKPKLPAAISFIVLAILWLWFQNYWLAAALIVLAFLDMVAGQKTALLFLPDTIEVRGFPKKIIHWHQLNNAILKDRILTLDFKNDHLLQGEIDAVSDNIDENCFTAFCRQQLQNKA